jgi:6-phosphofructokinase 1
MKHLGVLTSGGDAPGMNAAIRAVTREALARGVRVTGIVHGYAGVLDWKAVELTARAVGGIIHNGGTILGSARCQKFCVDEGLEQALHNLTAHGIEGLVVIGGNGSQTGAACLALKGYPVVGVASTIDNDLCGTELTIGVDTALNAAMEAIDRLRVTASSHRQVSLVEVMGRKCGYLALMAGLAGGAETVVIPEVKINPDDVIQRLRDAFERGKEYAIAVVAEGAEYNGIWLEKYFQNLTHKTGLEARLTTLGHIQRGGTPGAFDRILASELGARAADRLIEGDCGILVGWTAGKVSTVPLSEVVGKTKIPNLQVLELIHRLAQ